MKTEQSKTPLEGNEVASLGERGAEDSLTSLVTTAKENERVRTILEIYHLPEIQGDQFIELRLKILSLTK